MEHQKSAFRRRFPVLSGETAADAQDEVQVVKASGVGHDVASDAASERPVLSVVRNPQSDSSALSRSEPESPQIDGTSDHLTGVDRDKPAPTENAIPSTVLRALTRRPTKQCHVGAKKISRVDPATRVSAAADPAVLVDVHSDQRLSLGRLVKDTGMCLSRTWVVTALATGFIELAPQEVTGELALGTGSSRELTVRVDQRSRLRLTEALLFRLGVPAGGKALVTWREAAGTLRVLNLASLADAFEAGLDTELVSR